MAVPQVQDRSTFIGGSDAPAVLGLSRWQTPLGLWAEKTGQVVRKEEDHLYLRLGKRLEEVVAELFTEKTGKKVQRANESRVHKQHPFLRAQIDRLVVGEDAVLECKTASGWKAKEWEGEEIPQEYIIQVMHELAVTGRKRGYIAVLIGNQDFKWKVIERDEQMIKEMVKREVDFWNHFIVPKVMPGIVTKNDADTLYQLFPLADPGTTIELSDEANKLIESRNAMIEDIKNLEGQKDKVENEVKLMMKNFEFGRTSQWVVTWRNQVARRIDVEALKLTRPELYEAFAKPVPSRVFRARRQESGAVPIIILVVLALATGLFGGARYADYRIHETEICHTPSAEEPAPWCRNCRPSQWPSMSVPDYDRSGR